MKGGVAEEPEPQDRVQAIKDRIDEVTDEMKKNMKRILDRGEKTSDLMIKSEEIEEGAKHFSLTSNQVARSYWWKNVKLVVVIVVVILIIVVIIVLLATGVIPTEVTQTTKP